MFATLNSPGALAPLLGALAAVLSHGQAEAPSLAVVGAALSAVALSLTLVRSAWLSLIVAALAHVIASRGSSARLVFGARGGDRGGHAGAVPGQHHGARRGRPLQHDRQPRRGQLGRRPLGHVVRDAAGGRSRASRSRPGQRRRALQADRRHAAADPGQRLSGADLPGGPDGFLLVLARWPTCCARPGTARARGRRGRSCACCSSRCSSSRWCRWRRATSSTAAMRVVFWFIGGQVLAYDYFRRTPASASLNRAAAGALQPVVEAAAALAHRTRRDTAHDRPRRHVAVATPPAATTPPRPTVTPASTIARVATQAWSAIVIGATWRSNPARLEVVVGRQELAVRGQQHVLTDRQAPRASSTTRKPTCTRSPSSRCSAPRTVVPRKTVRRCHLRPRGPAARPVAASAPAGG